MKFIKKKTIENNDDIKIEKYFVQYSRKDNNDSNNSSSKQLENTVYSFSY